MNFFSSFSAAAVSRGPTVFYALSLFVFASVLSVASASSSLSPFSFASSSSSLPANGSLRFMALTNAENDQDQLASIAQINPSTGALSLHGNFSFAVTVAGMDCTTAYAGAVTVSRTPDRTSASSSTVYYAITGNGPTIDTIDAVSGKIMYSVLTEVAYGILAVAYDPVSSTLKGIGAPLSARNVQYLDINVTSGVIQVLNKDLPLPFPTPCEAALSLATSRYYTITQTKPNDDAPEELLTLDLDKGTILATIPLETINKKIGILNSLIVIPAATLSTNETIVSWSIDHNFQHPPTLLWIDPMTGLYMNLTSLPSTGAYNDCTVPLAASALLYIDPSSGNITIGSIIFDNAMDSTYLAMVTIQPHPNTLVTTETEVQTNGSTTSTTTTVTQTARYTVTEMMTMMNKDGTSNSPIVTLDLVKVHSEGTQLLWAPAWVTPPAGL